MNYHYRKSQSVFSVILLPITVEQAVAMLSTIHADLETPQDNQRSDYEQYAHLMQAFHQALPNLYEQVVSNWKDKQSEDDDEELNEDENEAGERKIKEGEKEGKEEGEEAIAEATEAAEEAEHEETESELGIPEIEEEPGEEIEPPIAGE